MTYKFLQKMWLSQGIVQVVAYVWHYCYICGTMGMTCLVEQFSFHLGSVSRLQLAFITLLNMHQDLTLSCASWETNAAYDIVPFPHDAHLNPIVMYLGDGISQYLTHPYASPLFGNFEGLPPMLIQCGEAEVLRDEIELLAHKASLAGVYVQLEVYEDGVSCSLSRNCHRTFIFLS